MQIVILPGRRYGKTAVKKFVAEYIAQDNAGTAWPYGYAVQQKVTRSVPPGCGDRRLYYCQELGEHYTHEELTELEIPFSEAEHVADYKEEWEHVQQFFLKSEAEAYLRRDAHNLKSTRLYVTYFRRNSEAEMILRTMFALAGVDYDKAARA